MAGDGECTSLVIIYFTNLFIHYLDGPVIETVNLY